MVVFASFNIKGGVGKTATAINLAYLSSQDGFRTLVWDLDPQSSATFYLRIQPKVKGGGKRLFRGNQELVSYIRGSDFENLDLLPADYSYRKLDLLLDQTKKPLKRLARLMEPLAGDYEHVFLDCPPGSSLISESVFVASRVLLVPTIPTTLSLRTLEQLGRHLKKSKMGKLEVWPFFCMVDRRKALHRDLVGSFDAAPFKMMKSTIPYSSVVEKMGLRRAPLPVFARTHPAARAYQHLWQEIKSRLSG